MGEEQALALSLEGRVAARGNTRHLVALADTLASLPDPEIDATFAATLEARLMTEGLEGARPRLVVLSAIPQTSADEVVRTADVVQMPSRRFAVRRSVVAVAAAAMLTAFPVVAAASALPDSPFYGLKRGIEKAQLAVFGTAVEDGFTHMKLSQRRVDEATQLIAMRADEALIASTLAAAEDHMEQGQALVFGNATDEHTLNLLAEQARLLEEQMSQIAPSLGSETASAVDSALGVARRIQETVAGTFAQTQGPLPLIGPALPSGLNASTGTVTTTTQSSTTTSTASTTTKTTSSSDDDGTASGTKPGTNTGTGRGKSLDGAGDGCEIAGSANGLGDTLSALTRLTCG